MEAWRVWPRRQKTVSPKYHRGQFFLQAQTDLSFLLTEGTRQVENLLEGEKRRAKRIHARTDKRRHTTLEKRHPSSKTCHSFLLEWLPTGSLILAVC
jgi:hypothetical protein